MDKPSVSPRQFKTLDEAKGELGYIEVLQIVNSHDRLTRRVGELEEILKMAGEMLKTYHEDAGNCDHAVNVCVCDIIKAREQIDQALAAHEVRR